MDLRRSREGPERAAPGDQGLEAQAQVRTDEETDRPAGGVLEHPDRDPHAADVAGARHVQEEPAQAEAHARGRGGHGGGRRHRGGGGGRALPDDPLDHAEAAVDAVDALVERVQSVEDGGEHPGHGELRGERVPVTHVDAAERDLVRAAVDAVVGRQVIAHHVHRRVDRAGGVVAGALGADAVAAALGKDRTDALVAVDEEALVDPHPVGAARRDATGERHRLAGGERDVPVAHHRRGADLRLLQGPRAQRRRVGGAQGAEVGRRVGEEHVPEAAGVLRHADLTIRAAGGGRLRADDARDQHGGEERGGGTENLGERHDGPLRCGGGVMELDDPRCALRFRGRVLCKGRDTSETELYPTLLFL